MSHSEIVGAVDIGTSKVVVLLAEIEGDRSMNIIGRGQCTITGMKKGVIVDIGSVSNATHAALASAEKMAGDRVERVYLAVSGAHLRGFRHPGATTISSSKSIVSENDIRRAVDNAKHRASEPGRIYVHHICNGFLLDRKPTEAPLGRQGSHLEALYWHVTGDEDIIRDHLSVIMGYGLQVDDLVASSLASGSFLATGEEKRQGVLVVDIGKGTTDYVLYRGRRVLQTGVIPVGGEHITNDLSLGLRVKSKLAENLKCRVARARVMKDDRNHKEPLVGDLSIGDSLHSLANINRITHARLEELFIILKNQLGSMVSPQNLPAGVILTGGVSQTPLIADLASEILDVPVSLGTCPEWVRDRDLRGPEYATVLGVLINALHDQQKTQNLKRQSRHQMGLLKKVAGLFA